MGGLSKLRNSYSFSWTLFSTTVQCGKVQWSFVVGFLPYRGTSLLDKAEILSSWIQNNSHSRSLMVSSSQSPFQQISKPLTRSGRDFFPRTFCLSWTLNSSLFTYWLDGKVAHTTSCSLPTHSTNSFPSNQEVFTLPMLATASKTKTLSHLFLNLIPSFSFEIYIICPLPKSN